jgi:L,D-peptidoglycan transpeptidase YkuD (ErfK/YbiS/YcfS/YnhG family)
VRLTVTLATVTTLGAASLAGFGLGPFRDAPSRADGRVSAQTTDGTASNAAASGPNSALPDPAQPTRTAPTVAPRTLPLGAHTLGTIAGRTTQVVIVRGATAGSNTATIQFYERVGADWVDRATWQGHVGKRGWSTRKVEGDLKTPVGTFGLTDAGGRKADPGSKLPYDQSTAFAPAAAQPGFGDSMADAFDYVIAVNYNRAAGRTPLDFTRPLGVRAGGGIWLHVDHDGPTHGCVSLPKAGMRYLLRHLSPAAHPVVVMGSAAQLDR